MAYTGETIFLRIYDLGGTVNLPQARAALGPLAEGAAPKTPRSAPEYVNFGEPLALNLSALGLELGDAAGRPVRLSARLHEVGGLALMLRVPVEGAVLGDFAKAGEWRGAWEGTGGGIRDLFERIEDRLLALLKPAIDAFFPVQIEAERYTIYAVTGPVCDGERLLADRRAEIAGLLLSEAHPDRLSAGEIEDTLRQRFSYYRDDLVVVDWDAAFVLEPGGAYEDLLYVFEVANLQLLVLRKYDRYLDGVLERGYGEFEALAKRPRLVARQAWRMSRELAEVRMDMAKVSDELANTSKFFGEWYLARVYMGVAGRLHVTDYRRTVDEKLETLKDLYQNVLHEIDVRRSMLLEMMIVALIVFEIVLAFLGWM
ncbi:MAG: hypothetical protein AMXMBFR7_21730 [Planctomycetota bacterium]